MFNGKGGKRPRQQEDYAEMDISTWGGDLVRFLIQEFDDIPGAHNKNRVGYAQIYLSMADARRVKARLNQMIPD